MMNWLFQRGSAVTGTLTAVTLAGALWVTPVLGANVVGHRGASHDAPENTLTAFRFAWEQGADGVEGDFHLTKDGHIVCFHDRTTKRTVPGTNLNIADTTLEELRKLEVGSWKHEKFRGEPVATLDEVFAVIPEDKFLYIEIKTGPEIMPALKSAIERSPLRRDQMRVIAFNADVIAAVKQEMPDIQAYWLVNFKKNKDTDEWTPTLSSILDTLRRTRADGLDCQAEREVVTRAFAGRIRAAGYSLHTWTVNNPEQAKYYAEIGFESITTDRPNVLRKAFDAKAAAEE